MKLQVMILTALTLIGSSAPEARCSGPDPERQIAWIGAYELALQEAQESGRPLLICLNMDGEAANDELALETYRAPDLVRRTRDLVPLIASAFRHDAREATAGASNRQPCPRFGVVTCDEHIAVERALREHWFAGINEIVSPQHILADPEGRALSLRKFELGARELCAMVDEILERPRDPRKVELFERRRIDKLLGSMGRKRSCCGDPALETLHALLSHGRSELVFKSLGKSKEVVRDQFVRGLPELGGQADEALCFFLSDRSPRVRAAAVETWDQMPQYLPSAKQKIQMLAEQERNRLVRRALEKAGAVRG